MTSLEISPLNPNFGVEVKGLPLSQFVPRGRFQELRALFEEHSALLFKKQDFDDNAHMELARAFGPIEDRKADERQEDGVFEIPKVSNVIADSSLGGDSDMLRLHLESNFLWHSDSTFILPPALTNILTARVVTTEGGALNSHLPVRLGQPCRLRLENASRATESGTTIQYRGQRYLPNLPNTQCFTNGRQRI